MVDPSDATKVYDVTYPWKWTATRADLQKAGTPAKGDAFLNACARLVDYEPMLAERPPEGTGCAWDQSERTMYSAPNLLAIGSDGTGWLAEGLRVTRTGAGRTDGHLDLPAPADRLLVDEGKTLVAWSMDQSNGVFISRDAAHHWVQVTDDMVPSLARSPESAFVIGDSAVMGPFMGRFWRTDDPGSASLVPLPAGPLTRFYAAGRLLWATALDSSDPTLTRKLWVSRDLGDTWAQVIDGPNVSLAEAVPASAIVQSDPGKVAALIKTLDPSDAVIDGEGNMLVLYENRRATRSAWQLLDSEDRQVAAGLGVWSAVASVRGFLVGTDQGAAYLDSAGTMTPAETTSSPAPVEAGDVVDPQAGMVFRASGPTIFRGLAQPNGTVTAQTSDGVMWALGKKTGGRTVVRWATPGGAWKSRDLGPDIDAERVYASGTVVLVPGYRKLYASNDSGKTWWLAEHHASYYSGGPPGFTILPDGSATGGDYRGGVSESRDLHTFSGPTYNGTDDVPVIGSLFSRARTGHGQDISTDRVHWVEFSPQAVRRLLADQAVMKVHG